MDIPSSLNRVSCCNRAHPLGLPMVLAIALCISGCSLPPWVHNGFKVGPDYRKPVAAVAESWIDSDDPRVLDQPPEYADWWSVFGDPVLDQLVETAYQQNLTLREAGMRVLQARAQRAVVAGILFPQQQQINGSFSRAQISVLGQPFLEPGPGFQRSFDNWFFAGDLSWELKN